MNLISRRSFLLSGGVLGGGLLLGYFAIPNRLAMRAEQGEQTNWLTTWVSIAPNNTVTVLVAEEDLKPLSLRISASNPLRC